MNEALKTAARDSGSADSGGSMRFLRERKQKGKPFNENQNQSGRGSDVIIAAVPAAISP